MFSETYGTDIGTMLNNAAGFDCIVSGVLFYSKK